jgi:predicted aspartyl protease
VRAETGARVWGCALVLGLCAMSGAARAECKIDEVGEIPIKVASPRILVDATLDGKPVEMIVDTGSATTLISRKAAERLGLKTHIPNSGLRISGIGGEAVTLVASVGQLSFGRFSLKNDSVIVAGDLDRDGLVGRDMFQNYDVEIDLAHSAIRLLHPVGCSDAEMVYWGGTSYSEAPLDVRGSFLEDYKTEILLNGRSFPAVLDTGTPRTTVTVGAAELAGVTLATPGSIAARDTGGLGPRRIPSFSGLFKSVGIGDEAVNNTRIFVADLWKYNKVEQLGTRLGAINDDPTYGLIGNDFFRSHRVLISPSHHKVFFSYLGGPIFLPYASTTSSGSGPTSAAFHQPGTSPTGALPPAVPK